MGGGLQFGMQRPPCTGCTSFLCTTTGVAVLAGWLLGCSAGWLAGLVRDCSRFVLAQATSAEVPANLQSRLLGSCGCLVVLGCARWPWCGLAVFAWVLVGGCRVCRLAVLAWVGRLVRVLCCWFGAARWLSGWLWWPPGLVLSLAVWLGSVLPAVVSVLVGWWFLAAVVGWCCRRCGVVRECVCVCVCVCRGL